MEHDEILRSFNSMTSVEDIISLYNSNIDLKEVKDSFTGDTVLHTLADYGRLECIKYLIEEKGFDPHCVNKGNNTILHNACWSGSIDLVKYLVLEIKMDVNVQDRAKVFPSMWAAASGRIEVLKFLIEQGADYSRTDMYGNSILTEACKKGYKDMVEYIVNALDFDISKTNSSGTTCLHWACAGGDSNFNLVKLLVEEYCFDVNVKNNDGRTPLFSIICSGTDDGEVRRYLLENGAQVDITTLDGETLLEVAEDFGLEETIEDLEKYLPR
ncbi:MAG: ankyrin repeat domain-containing protein [Spirochaetales bacterium]|nr:ankyrin repeat domain-containing protein [Spirochaetales bacterium]